MRGLAALVAAAAACGPTIPAADAGDDLGDGACGARGATLTVGTATGTSSATARPLSDGDPVYLTPGPQGGQHIWVALEGRGFDGTQPRVELHAYDAETGRALGSIRVRLRFSLAPTDATLLQLAPQTLILDDDAYCGALGRAVRLTVDLSDGAGRCLHEERRVTLVDIDPAADPRDRSARLSCCAQRWPRCYPDAGVLGFDGGGGG